jgi:origin recognition complex subunit 4
MVDACLEQAASEKPIVLRLSGWVQSTDRHALREIAFQLLQQTGTALLPESSTDTDALNPDLELDEEENPFLEAVDHTSEEATLTLPPSSQLHALIPILLTLSRPVIVILDAFDLFALHPRQSLLYCLLDTVQNCRASSESRGIVVIGITSRVDTIQLLEKRVKSRFSGRTIRTAPPGSLQTSLDMVKTILQPSEMCDEDEHVEEWKQRWTASVKKFLEDNSVTNVLNETFGVTRDFKVIIRILVNIPLSCRHLFLQAVYPSDYFCTSIDAKPTVFIIQDYFCIC